VDILPTFSSLSLIRKIGEIRICSLWRKFVGITIPQKDHFAAKAHAPIRGTFKPNNKRATDSPKDGGRSQSGAGPVRLSLGAHLWHLSVKSPQPLGRAILAIDQ
jgi:hypothetical protein